MKQAIEAVINNIPKGHIFDSHFIIDQLIKNHSDTYLTFSKRFKSDETVTLPMHGQLAQVIKTVEGVESAGRSYSKNIHGNNSDCEAWIKK